MFINVILFELWHSFAWSKSSLELPSIHIQASRESWWYCTRHVHQFAVFNRKRLHSFHTFSRLAHCDWNCKWSISRAPLSVVLFVSESETTWTAASRRRVRSNNLYKFRGYIPGSLVMDDPVWYYQYQIIRITSVFEGTCVHRRKYWQDYNKFGSSSMTIAKLPESSVYIMVDMFRVNRRH